ncbi:MULTISPECIES: helix-turn-helix transcriptional regulator [unclassified Pseudomonas]|uniref:helix-turn-helix transcriptional regulator n=1 Tax=unclassified Pseudomonas TaxID=196821 RepID=UPI0004747D88|nr:MULTISPECIES: AlpA family transcriptional regulator [unclassified Pseudomonas]QJI13864.1 AlpA family transcriptional regulator [Pseudomonas sp. ADAK22]
MNTEPKKAMQILRMAEVTRRVGLSKSTIYDRINPRSTRYDNTFPKPIKIGLSAVGWLEEHINSWIESRITLGQE